jgi:hypothetical protein
MTRRELIALLASTAAVSWPPSEAWLSGSEREILRLRQAECASAALTSRPLAHGSRGGS